MRFLVLSDIHGNRFGLEAVLADAQGRYDQLICLGDIVGYGAHPNQCCEIVRANNAWCLAGNHDAAALGLIDIEWFNPIAKQAILWTRDQLTAENKDWIGAMQPLEFWPEHGFQAVHGSLREPLEEYITGANIAEGSLLVMEEQLCFFGHTHVAVSYSCPADPEKWTHWDQLEQLLLPQGGEVEIYAEQKYLVNPGSCGQPRDGNPQARYALFDSETGGLEIVAVDYNQQAARAAIYEAGLPTLLGDRLLQGR